MPNGNAKKVVFLGDGKQPILNLTDDLPKIYSDFKTVEHITAPYINDMISPVYIRKNPGVEYVYDKYNNRYNIKSGVLYRNDVPLEDIQDVSFVQEDITEEYSGYAAFDVDNSGVVASLTIGTDLTVHVKYGSVVYDSPKPVFSQGVLLTSRVRILDDGSLITVAVFESSDGQYYYNLYAKTVTGTVSTWHKMVFKTVFCKTANHSSDSEQPAEYTCRHINPLINICQVPNVANTYGISILPYRGVLRGQHENGFYSIIVTNNTIKIVYEDIRPSMANITQQTVSTAYSKSFTTNIHRNNTTNIKKAILNNGVFYTYDNDTKGDPITFPAGTNPTSLGYTITIDDVVYNVYNYFEYTVTTTVNVSDNGPDTAQATFSVNGSAAQNTGTPWTSIVTTLDFRFTYAVSSITVSYRGNTFTIPQTYWSNNTQYYTEVTTTGSTNITVCNAPNVFLDDGKMVACTAGRAWDLLSASPTYIVETGFMSGISGSTYNWTSVEQFLPVDENGSYTRVAYISASRTFQQNFYVNTGLLSTAVVDSDEDINKDHYYMTFSNTNCADIRFNIGTRFQYGAFTTYVDPDGKRSNCIYPNTGYRTNLGNGWHLCINPLNGTFFSVGISYAESDSLMGTVLTDWLKISDSFYIISRPNMLIFKDSFNRTYKITKKQGATLQAILGNRYIICNTTSYYNAYDSQNNRLTHYATDYNARALAGTPSMNLASFTQAKVIQNRLFQTGINAIILDANEIVDDNDRMPSWTLPIQKLDLCNIDYDVKAFKSEIPFQNNAYIKGISVYYGADDLDAGYYQYTISVQGNTQTTFTNPRYTGTTYPVSSEAGYYAYGSPSLLAKYVHGIGPNDYVHTTQASYPLRIYNSNQVVLSYNMLSQLQNVDAFFILQGQYYGVIDDKIYSVTYYNGQISEIGTIVDITGFKFIGNNPMIAFFWSEKLKAIYSFTGDANMQLIWAASKVDTIPGDFYYDDATHSIYIPSSEGLIVVAEQHVYKMDQFTNVTNVQCTDTDVHITDSGNTYDVRYYPSEGYIVEPAYVETGFFGTGDKENITIDRWNIALYTPTPEAGSIIVSTTTLTDVITKSADAELIVHKNMWQPDPRGEGAIVYITYNPKCIKGQGIKLAITSPWSIASITPHVADYGKDTLTKVMR